jgi:DNA-directed RNA polymerase subunit RPC12/RpoP
LTDKENYVIIFSKFTFQTKQLTKENKMKCRCPHCSSLRSGLRSNTTYTCGNCGKDYTTPNDRGADNAFNDMNIPGEGVFNTIEKIFGKILG